MTPAAQRAPEDIALIKRLSEDLQRAYEVINRHGLMDEVFPAEPKFSLPPLIKPADARAWRLARARAEGTRP